jgi:hypothetical protein
MTTSYDPPRRGRSSSSTADSVATRDRELASREYWEDVAKEQHKEKVAQRRRSQPLRRD